MLPVGQRLDGAEPVHDVVRVAEVDLVERAPNDGVSLRANNAWGCLIPPRTYLILFSMSSTILPMLAI